MRKQERDKLEARAQLNNCEVFHVNAAEAKLNRAEEKKHGGQYWRDNCQSAISVGWYFWQCFPGCLPEGAPLGPYKTYSEALSAADEFGYLGDEE